MVIIIHSSIQPVSFLTTGYFFFLRRHFHDGRTTIILSWSAKLSVCADDFFFFFYVHYTNCVCGSSTWFRRDLGGFRVNYPFSLAHSLPIWYYGHFSTCPSFTLYRMVDSPPCSRFLYLPIYLSQIVFIRRRRHYRPFASLFIYTPGPFRFHVVVQPHFPRFSHCSRFCACCHWYRCSYCSIFFFQ